MLPLWIIDLQQDGERSELLQGLISSLGKHDDDRRADKYGFFSKQECWVHTRYVDNRNDPDWFRGFVNKLVEDGEQFVRYLNENHPVNDPCVNVCVLGDASELFSLTIFSAVAAILKKEKPLIFSEHVQQGINVLGMLYVPSNVNTLPYLKRQSVLRCLKELQVQRTVSRSGGYDKVMLYQDTQHRTEKYYTLLTPAQQVDYIFQCLVHLYYVCDSLHPLLDGSNANDDFYFTMGAGSLYYDPVEQDDQDEVLVGNALMVRFKEKGEADASLEKINVDILDEDITPIKLLSQFPVNRDLPDPRDMVRDCSKHPVDHFYSKFLKKRFYVDYLQHYVENYQKQVIRKVAHWGANELLGVNDLMASYEQKIKARIDANIPQLIRLSSSEFGALSLIEGKLSILSEEVKQYKIDLKGDVEECIWNRVHDMLDEQKPNYFGDAFAKYHEAFRSDSEKATAHPACDEMKAEKMKELTAHLKKDATVLSRIVRAFIAGIVAVIAFMPVLETISPRLVNLGDVAHHPFFYAFTLFLIPAIVEAIRFWRYHRKRKRFENEIVAFYLHDSYARLANRYYNKIYQLYDFVARVVERYQKRCEKIRADSADDFFHVSKSLDLVLPRTMFNQPVIGGKCCGQKIFADDKQNHNTLQIDIDRVKIDKITRSQEYYLINKYSELFGLLFKVFDSVIPPSLNLSRRPLPWVEMKDEDDEMYKHVKLVFESRMKERLKELFIKRDDSTVGEKLDLYRRSVINKQGFDLFCHFTATSGEFTANDNESFADIKSNSHRMPAAFGPFLPLKTTYQVTGEDDNENTPEADLFRKYLFLTRWRTFNFITASRILPEIDLEDRDFSVDYGFGEGEQPPVASIVLYSILGNLSAEWYTLFNAESTDRLKDRLQVRKKGGTWQVEEKRSKKKGRSLEPGTIPYYDMILDPKVD